MDNQIFWLVAPYSPSPDQENAIKEIVEYINDWYKYQTLWWVTGSWKTFTMANVIREINKPTLVIAHNKTLAAQLAQEFKEFFPNNAVHYFVSYYDYYQPEAYVAKTDTYIEKEATVNEEIDRLRHAATKDLLTRKDVIIVASVSCIYGIWDISSYIELTFDIEVWKEYQMEEIMKDLINIQYRRAINDFHQGMFQFKGDTLEIFPPGSENMYVVEFWDNEVTAISEVDHITWEVFERLNYLTVFPAKHTVTTNNRIMEILPYIQKELEERLEYFKEQGDVLRYERLKTKVEYDLEMLMEVWYVNWIENYSRYLDWRQAGQPPATLIDYFGDDFLCFVDESHMTFSQVNGMYGGDRSRKENLVENGFRLPSALDNRPLKFPEFEWKLKSVVAVSATPWPFEIDRSSADGQRFFDFDPMKDWVWSSSVENRVVPQIMRPTGLLDPEIVLKPMEFMVDDIMHHITEITEKNERMLITTITKRSSEDLTDYLVENWVNVKYLHSDVDTLDRLEILKELREGKIDVIVWVNLLREWLDLPEVSKICILDADKQWFLRSETSLIQIIGRAARNENWTVYMYSEQLKIPKWDKSKDIKEYLANNFSVEFDWLYRIDKWRLANDSWLIVSEAMRRAINITYYRRWLQEQYNKEHSITPKTIFSNIKDMWIKTKKKDLDKIDKASLTKELKRLELEMDIAAANLEFEKAAELRDMIIELKREKRKK